MGDTWQFKTLPTQLLTLALFILFFEHETCVGTGLRMAGTHFGVSVLIVLTACITSKGNHQRAKSCDQKKCQIHGMEYGAIGFQSGSNVTDFLISDRRACFF